MEVKGTVRAPALVWGLIFIPLIGPFTALFHRFTWLSELKAYLGDESINPVMDIIVFPIVSCGLYSFYMPFKMGKLIQRAQIKAGMADAQDQGLMFLLFSFLCGFSLYKEQEELNKVWSA
jgi:hypothetical protein